MITIIAGTRNLCDPDLIYDAIKACGWVPTEVVSGGCHGVDQAGEEWARAHGVPVRVFPANWSLHGRAAGPMRNRTMAGYAEALLAIWDGTSRGTKNMIDEAKTSGLRIHVYHSAKP